jgi:hypothetical protein
MNIVHHPSLKQLQHLIAQGDGQDFGCAAESCYINESACRLLADAMRHSVSNA